MCVELGLADAWLGVTGNCIGCWRLRNALEGAARAIGQEFWEKKVFDTVLDLEQLNVDVYRADQRSKDEWLRQSNYPVDLVRKR